MEIEVVMIRTNPYRRRNGKRVLARRLALFAVCVAAVCCARTFHRSFRNGYPAEWNISKDKAEESFSIKGGKVSYSDGTRSASTALTRRNLTSLSAKRPPPSATGKTSSKRRHARREMRYGKRAA